MAKNDRGPTKTYLLARAVRVGDDAKLFAAGKTVELTDEEFEQLPDGHATLARPKRD